MECIDQYYIIEKFDKIHNVNQYITICISVEINTPSRQILKKEGKK